MGPSFVFDVPLPEFFLLDFLGQSNSDWPISTSVVGTSNLHSASVPPGDVNQVAGFNGRKVLAVNLQFCPVSLSLGRIEASRCLQLNPDARMFLLPDQNVRNDIYARKMHFTRDTVAFSLSSKAFYLCNKEIRDLCS